MRRVAVLLATYNGSLYLKEQIESILTQTYTNLMIYAHDDGSNDGTIQILRTYEKLYPDQFQILDGLVFGNARDNFLYLLKNVKEQYIMFCDQDDVWLPDKVEVSLQRIVQLENDYGKATPCLVFSDLYVVDQKLKVLHESYLQCVGKNPTDLTLHSIIRENVAAGCTIIINKSLADEVNSICITTNVYIHDWWILLIAVLTGKIAYIDKPLLLYRQHSNNAVGVVRYSRWISEKFHNIISGRQVQNSFNGIVTQRNVASELLQLSNLSKKDRDYLETIVNIENQPKSKRIWFYYKNQLLKKNWKNLWKLILV